MSTVTRGTMMEPETISEIFNKVQGHSTLAKLSGAMPIAFNGNDIFTFSLDSDVNIVGEGEVKSAGGATVNKVTMRPVKVEYSARFSDEFIYGSDEKKLEILSAFSDGVAKKIARGIDIMGIHGMNPRTGTVATQLGSNYIDAAITASGNKVTYTEADPESNLEDAVAMLGDNNVTGFAFSKTFASDLAKLKANGVAQYPEFRLGANPGNIGGTNCDVNTTVNFGSSADRAIVGDFQNAIKWGYAKELPLDVIEYGDPDNSGKDLKAYNEICLRTEVYIGFGVLDTSAFAAVQVVG